MVLLLFELSYNVHVFNWSTSFPRLIADVICAGDPHLQILLCVLR